MWISGSNWGRIDSSRLIRSIWISASCRGIGGDLMRGYDNSIYRNATPHCQLLVLIVGCWSTRNQDLRLARPWLQWVEIVLGSCSIAEICHGSRLLSSSLLWLCSSRRDLPLIVLPAWYCLHSFLSRVLRRDWYYCGFIESS